MTNQLKNTIKKKNNSFKKWLENPSEENHKKYRQQRNLATKAIKNARLSYFDSLTKKKDKTNKSLFSAFSQFCTDKKSVELNINPEIFNDYFAGIGKNLASSLNETDICFGREIINSFVMSPVTEKEVSASFRSLKNKASSGHDGISNKIVNISISVISHPLTKLFNQRINLGYFPSEWKLAKIKPLFENGSKTDPSCYRPISLLSSLSKVFEKILFNRMMHFIKKFKIINENQFGFQQEKSCKISF